MATPAKKLTCKATGVEFVYAGRGRPPLYAPGVKRPVKPRAKKVKATPAEAVAA
jgi:hypothetical protein